MAEEAGFEPAVHGLAAYDSLANCWFQPLTHSSNTAKIKITKRRLCHTRIWSGNKVPAFIADAMRQISGNFLETARARLFQLRCESI